MNQFKDTKCLEILQDMECGTDDYIALSWEDILCALKIEGSFTLLELTKEDMQQDLQTQNLKYQISQSRGIVAVFEADGENVKEVEEFITHIKSFTDDAQHFVFGIKKVKQLSDTPLKILFSGILPINQLQMRIGEVLQEFIDSDEEYFKKRFRAFRDVLSEALGVRILPVFARKDKTLAPKQIEIREFYGSGIIAKFEIDKPLSHGVVEEYLERIFEIYLSLQRKQHLGDIVSRKENKRIEDASE